MKQYEIRAWEEEKNTFVTVAVYETSEDARWAADELHNQTGRQIEIWELRLPAINGRGFYHRSNSSHLVRKGDLIGDQ